MPKGDCIDPVKGYWAGTNATAVKNSQGTVPEVALYSIMENPMTACGCFECIVMYIPEVEGVMVVSREDISMTPAGMTFSTLAGMAGGGLQTPGVMGIGKFYLTSPKFISADGGFKRIVWMSSFLKDSMADEFAAVAKREEVPDLIDRIADERVVATVDELVSWIKEHNHPVLGMGVMQAASGAPVEAASAAPAQAVDELPTAELKVQAEPAPAREREPEPAAMPVAAAKPQPEHPTAVAASTVTAVAGDDIQRIAEISAGIVVDSLRRALVAALGELGGTGGVVYAAIPGAPVEGPAAVDEWAAPAPKVFEEPSPAAAETAAGPEVAAVKRERPTAPRWEVSKEAGFEVAKETWVGHVREVTIGATSADDGTRTSTVTVGGQTAMPFLDFEGDLPRRPVIAIEIQDRRPGDWSRLLMDAWGDVVNDPAQWAQAAEKTGADLIVLQLSLEDGDGNTTTSEKTGAVVRKVLNATGLPLVVLGPGQIDADNDLLVAVAEEAAGERVLLGVCEGKNYRTIVAAAMANGHLVTARTAMDVNLAKQLNILISDMGLPLDRIVMDPTCAGVGYGMEYGYSVMERLRLAALQGDTMTQLPMVVTVGSEAWRQKESKVGEGVPEAWGDWKERALNWETVTAAALIEAGADIVVLRHPESVRRVDTMIEELMG